MLRVTAHDNVGKPRQELKQRPWRDTAHWLAPSGLLSSLSYTAQVHLPRRGNANSRLDLPTPRKCPPDMPTGQFDEGSSTAEASSSRVCQVRN